MRIGGYLLQVAVVDVWKLFCWFSVYFLFSLGHSAWLSSLHRIHDRGMLLSMSNGVRCISLRMLQTE